MLRIMTLLSIWLIAVTFTVPAVAQLPSCSELLVTGISLKYLALKPRQSPGETMDRMTRQMAEIAAHANEDREHTLQEVLEKEEARWRKTTRAWLLNLGYQTKDRYDEESYVGQLLDIKDLAKHNPYVGRIVDPELDLVYAPIQTGGVGHNGGIYSAEKMLLLPPLLPFAPSSFKNTMTMLHESIHYALHKARGKGEGRFGYYFLLKPEATAEVQARGLVAYSVRFNSEEVATFIAEAAMALDCIAIAQVPVSFINRGYNYVNGARYLLEAYFKSVYPRTEKLRTGNIADVMFNSGNEQGLKLEQMDFFSLESKKELVPSRVAADLLADHKALTEIENLIGEPAMDADSYEEGIQKFAKDTDLREKLWGWLASLGIESENFRPTKAECESFQ